MVRIDLGEVRCPKCHKKGLFACYVTYEEGEVKFDSQIEHELTEKQLKDKKKAFKGCFLELEPIGIGDVVVLPRVIGSHSF